MPHDTSLIHTIVAGLVLAFVFAAIATRLRQPPLVGYLLAGVMVGPYTPGFVADQALVPQLAEIGVILLMFGVGLHFSPRDFRAVRGIAVTGALIQIAFATLLGWGLGALMGWSTAGSLLFGLTLSVASTVVLLKWLQDRHMLETERGRIAVGWLVVEDLAMVLALVLIPAAFGATGTEEQRGFFVRLASSLLDVPPSIGIIAGVTLLKVAVFIGLMLLVGRRLVPALLHWVAHSGSRELFRLAVLASALGIAYGAAELFGVSFALGAFFAGMVLSESQLSSRAAQESLPLRDAFAVLFFISVGMLFDPAIIIRDPLPVLGTVMIIMFGRSAAVFLVVLAFRHTVSTATVIAFSRAQIGEFSFILVGLGVTLGLLPEEGRGLVLAGAMITIVLNPLLLFTAERLRPLIEARLRPTAPASEAGLAQSAEAEAPPDGEDRTPDQDAEAEADELPEEAEPSTLSGHTILIGFGGVGQSVGAALDAAGETYLVIEAAESSVAELRERGIEAFAGNAASPDILALANPAEARCLVVTIADVFEAGQITEQARDANPAIRIVARAHSEAEADHLDGLGADIVIRAEGELARGMIERLANLPPPASPDPRTPDPDSPEADTPDSAEQDRAAPATT